MGINGYAYVDNDYHCMTCDEQCESSSCNDGPRILPWVQDVPNIQHTDLDNQDDCLNNGFEWVHNECIELVDVWGNWDIILRDLVIVSRDGYEITRINLTATNPDPESTCGENYDTIKQLILDAR